MPTTPDSLNAELVVQIKAEMDRQGLSFDALANRLGVQTSTLKSRMASSHGLRIAHLAHICDALGVSPVTLTARAYEVVAA